MWLTFEDIQTFLLFYAVFCAAYFYYIHRPKQTFNSRGPRPPTLASLPFLGSLPFLPRPHKMHTWFMERLPTMGAVVGFYARSKYVVFLQTRKALNDAYVKQSRDFGSRPVMCLSLLLNPRLHGIFDRPLNQSFEKYHRLTLSILRSLCSGNRCIMESRINREVEDLVAELKKHHSAPLCPISIVNGSVVNVIISLLFGRRLDRSHPPALSELVTQIDRFRRGLMTAFPVNLFPFLRFMPPLRRLVGDLVAVHGWLLRFLDREIDGVLTNGDAEASFVRSFVEAECANSYDRDELLHLLRDMIVAGSETSSAAVLWMIVVLAEYRDVQTRLQKQIDAVVGGGSSDGGGGTGAAGVGQGRGRLPLLADRPRLAYIEATILELMRFKNVTPVGVPRETVRDAVVDGYTIPAETMVIPNLYAIHMDPAVWQDPATFRPERFLNDAGNVIGREQVIPFSIGRRSCLGELLAHQEVFLFITGLLQNFDILPPDGERSLNCTEVAGTTFAPSPFKVRFVPRKRNHSPRDE